MKYAYIKITAEEADEYALHLDKIMALRTLRIINSNGDFELDEREIRRDTIIASENMNAWWDKIEKKYSIPSNGKRRNIDYQNNLLTYEV